MTRFDSNITRSSADASAAGVCMGALSREHTRWHLLGVSVDHVHVRDSRANWPECLSSNPRAPNGGDSADPPLCSAKGCRRPATWDLSWRNPKLHDAARVKHWLGCDDHVDGLAEFLSVRGFLIARDRL